MERHFCVFLSRGTNDGNVLTDFFIQGDVF